MRITYCRELYDIVHYSKINIEKTQSCVSCSKPVVWDSKKESFVHIDSECICDSKNKILEYRLKKLLDESTTLMLPPASLGWNEQIPLTSSMLVVFDDINTFDSFGGIKPFAVCSKGRKPLLLDVCFKPELSEKRKEALSSIAESVLIIDLSGVDSNISESELSDILTKNISNKYWFNNMMVYWTLKKVAPMLDCKRVATIQSGEKIIQQCSRSRRKGVVTSEECSVCDFNITPRNIFSTGAEVLYCGYRCNIKNRVDFINRTKAVS